MSGTIKLSSVDLIAISSEVERVRCVVARSFLVRDWCGSSAIEILTMSTSGDRGLCLKFVSALKFSRWVIPVNHAHDYPAEATAYRLACCGNFIRLIGRALALRAPRSKCQSINGLARLTVMEWQRHLREPANCFYEKPNCLRIPVYSVDRRIPIL
jgi:hypothetical protein